MTVTAGVLDGPPQDPVAFLPPPHLTRILIRLRWRLLRNRMKSERGKVRFFGGLVVALWLGGTAAVAMVAFGHANDPRIGRIALLGGFLGVFVAWTVLPILTFGVDESLDPTRLVQFPITTRALTRGLLAASFIGIAPMAVIVVGVGTVVGYAQAGAWLVGVPAVALLLLLSAACSRAVIASLSAALRSRKGRDAAVIGGAMLGLSFQLLRLVKFASLDAGTADTASRIIRWLPPAMLGQAVIDARHGRWVAGVAELLPAAGCIPLVILWWSHALERSMTVTPGGQTAARRSDGRDGLDLMFRRLPLLPSTPWGAVAAKELRYASREPRRKVSLFNSVVIGLAGPVFFEVRAGGHQPATVLLASLAGYILILASVNQFGFDRGALWIDAMGGDHPVRTALIGKNVAALIQVTPIVVASGLILAAVTGGWIYFPAALVLAAAGMGAGFASGNIASVRFPVRLPASNNPFASTGQGQGCATGLIVLGSVMAQNIVVAPVAVSAGVAVSLAPATLVFIAPICALYGAVLYWTGLRIASAYGDAHLPELIAKVDPYRTG